MMSAASIWFVALQFGHLTGIFLPRACLVIPFMISSIGLKLKPSGSGLTSLSELRCLDNTPFVDWEAFPFVGDGGNYQELQDPH